MINITLLKSLVVFATIVLLLLYIFSLSILRHFPIYPDEITIRLVLSRMFYDFPTINNSLPFCESFEQSRPLAWYFPGMIGWLLDSQINSLKMLRIIGLIFNVGIITLLIWTLFRECRKLVTNNNHSSMFYWMVICIGLILSLLSIGVLPVFLVINRNEQPIILCLIVLLSIVSAEKIQYKSAFSKTKLIVIFYAITSLLLFAHPKALLLIPVILLIAYRLFSSLKNRLLSIALMLILIFLIMLNFSAWSHAYKCSETPGMMKFLGDMTLKYQDIFYNQHHFFAQINQSLRSTLEYFRKIGFQTFSEVGYLPPLQLTPIYKCVNILIRIKISILFLTISTLLPFYSYRDFQDKKYFSFNVLLLVLFLSACVGAIFNLTKHWYDVDYFWILLIIVFVFFIKDHLQYHLKNKICNLIQLYLICSGIFSLSIFLYGFAAPIKSGFQGPGIQIHNYDEKKMVYKLHEAIKNCHINLIGSKHLILDNLTYWYFRKSKNPLLIDYVHLSYSLDKPSNYFRAIIQNSSGLITRCSSISVKSLHYTTHIGSICCAQTNLVKKIIQNEF